MAKHSNSKTKWGMHSIKTMKYITVRILYPETINDIPCQSLVPINSTLEYDEGTECAQVFDGEFDIIIPMSKAKYLGLIQNLKYEDVLDTSFNAFRYNEITFHKMLERVKNYNEQKGFNCHVRQNNHNSIQI